MAEGTQKKKKTAQKEIYLGGFGVRRNLPICSS
jgi:hypothetical protein